MDKLVPVFKETIFDDNMKSNFADLVEVGIDSLLDSEILKKIPIARLLVGSVELGQKIYERNLLKQTVSFINEFNRGEVSQEKLRAHKLKLDENPKLAERELERVIITLNGNVDMQKSQILGCLYSNYINKRIDWNQFCEMTEITNRIFIQDLSYLRSLWPSGKRNILDKDEYRFSRLESLGLLKIANIWSDMNDSGLDLLSSGKNAELSAIGQKYSCIIHEIIDNSI
jgi:hypothetical protein